MGNQIVRSSFKENSCEDNPSSFEHGWKSSSATRYMLVVLIKVLAATPLFLVFAFISPTTWCLSLIFNSIGTSFLKTPHKELASSVHVILVHLKETVT